MAANDTDSKECSLLRFTMRPERIHFLKFILEGYDGLGILTTVDAAQGIVEIRHPPEVAGDVKNLLDHIHSTIA